MPTLERKAPPSTYAIAAWLDGEPGAFSRVVLLTTVRALPIGVGMALVGHRERIVRDALIVSGVLTLGMALYLQASTPPAQP